MSRLAMLLALGAALSPAFALPALHYRFDKEWGEYGQGDNQFYSPMRLNINGNTIYIGDRDNHRVMVFDLDGNFIMKYGSFGLEQDNLRSPFEVDFDLAGNLWIPDWGNGRLMKRSSTLGYLAQYGANGSAPTEFQGPRALAVDREHGGVFVADTLNHRISKWTLSGEHLFNFGTQGTDPGQLNQPYDVAYGSGYVYVADTENHRIQQFDTSGGFVRQWNGSAGGGLLNWPPALTVSPNGRVFVADGDNNRVVQYTLTGSFVNTFGRYGTGPGEFDMPAGVAVDSNLRVFVSDGHGHCIQRFRLNARPAKPANLSITPQPALDSRNLIPHASSTDADGDTVKYVYLWYGSPDKSTWT